MNEEPNNPIIFFDGRCPFCHRAVRMLIALDRREVLRFAPLQGETAERYLDREARESLSTLIYRAPGGEQAQKSRAFLNALQHLGEVRARSARLLEVLPTAVRDWLYDVVAENRYDWFGQYEACRLPEGDDQRFLP